MASRAEIAREIVGRWKEEDPEIQQVYAFHLDREDAKEPSEYLIVTGSCFPANQLYAPPG